MLDTHRLVRDLTAIYIPNQDVLDANAKTKLKKFIKDQADAIARFVSSAAIDTEDITAILLYHLPYTTSAPYTATNAGDALDELYSYITTITTAIADLSSTISSLTTDDVPEGTTNLYYTAARFDTRFATKTTSNLTEGSNLYYTDTRVRNADIFSGFVAGGNTSIAAGDTVYQAFGKVQGQINAREGTITAGTTAQYWRGDKTWQTLDTLAVPENTNLYYTTSRARGSISTTGSFLSYNNVSGVLSTTYTPVNQAGDTMTGMLYFGNNYGVDVTATGGSDVLNIGTSNADVINIGYSGSTVNIMGAVFNVKPTNSYVTDKLITLNKGGGAATGVSVGFEIEEAGTITGYWTTNGSRDGWDFKSPAIAYYSTISQSLLTANRIVTLPDVAGTFITTGNLSSITATGTIVSGVWQGSSISTTYTDAKIKTVTQTANRITIGGTSTDPTFDISTAYVGQATITTLGTVATGVWNGTAVGLAYGGTNANLIASNGGIFYSTATAGAILAGTATAGQIIRSGASAAPSWSTATYPATISVSCIPYASSVNVIGEDANFQWNATGLHLGYNGTLSTASRLRIKGANTSSSNHGLHILNSSSQEVLIAANDCWVYVGDSSAGGSLMIQNRMVVGSPSSGSQGYGIYLPGASEKLSLAPSTTGNGQASARIRLYNSTASAASNNQVLWLEGGQNVSGSGTASGSIYMSVGSYGAALVIEGTEGNKGMVGIGLGNTGGIPNLPSASKLHIKGDSAITNILRLADNSANDLMLVRDDNNIALFGTGSFGSGVKVLYIGDATTVPTSNPSNGFQIYSESSAAKVRGGSGTITTFGPADPHCPVCGSDFVNEWENTKYGYLAVCISCLSAQFEDAPFITRKKGLWKTHNHGR